jgi:hypothetical protein
VPAIAAVSILCAWVVVDSIRAHPDYLAYFNQFAGQHPETILAESDLDWGQDLDRLSARLKQLNVTDVSIAYFGSALLEKSGLPTYHTADPTMPSKGYVAVSVHRLTIDYAKDGSYGWLKSYTPRERVGKSIDLFYIP